MLTAGATVAGVDRRFLKPGWLVGHLLVLAACLVCLRLGWWQWDRTHDADGTLQNLAYAALWPAFGAAFIYMWVRFLLLEKGKDTADEQQMDQGLTAMLVEGSAGAEGLGEATRLGGGLADVRTATVGDPEWSDERPNMDQPPAVDDAGRPSGHPQSTRPTRPELFVGTVEDVDGDEDPELAAYNRALAALAEQDRKRAR